MPILLDTHLLLWRMTGDPALSPRARAAVGAESAEVFVNDPFDRILAAQALLEDMTLVTSDPAFAAFGVNVLW
jgi:PIN domain nuclease of toxin-antitoxin system